MTDHDQLLKSFLKEFLAEFFELFFPDWAARFDFSHVEWLDQEVFPDPPDGSRHVVDLVAKLRLKEAMGAGSDRADAEWLSLIHIEIESADSVRPLRRRMHWYYSNLRQRHDSPVLPVALYLSVGLDGLGIEEYREDFGPLDVLRFRYLYVGLPGLDGIEYLRNGDEVSAALLSLMRVPDNELPAAASEATQKIAASHRTEQQKYLLLELLEKYLQFKTPEQEQEFERLMSLETYREAEKMAVTTFEKGVAKGRAEALERQREMAAVMLLKKFGALPADIRTRLDHLTFDELLDLCPRIVDATSLDELGLAPTKSR